MNKKRLALLFLLSVIVLFFNFFDHRLSTLSSERFADNEFPSERYVFSRLVYDLEHGTKAEGGFLLRHKHVDDLYKADDKDDFADFQKKLPGEIDSVYDSHTGLQDDILWPLWKGLSHIKEKILSEGKEGSRWHKRMEQNSLYYFYKISQALIALANALILSLIVVWAAREFKSMAAGLFLLGSVLLFMPALTFFGKSLWWMMGIWFLPFIASLWFYALNDGRPLRALPLAALSILVTAFVCLRGATGYEYISTAGIAAIVPPAYYALRAGWKFKTWAVQCFAIGLFALAGLAAALWLHWNALSLHGADPLDVITQRWQLRAHGGETVAGDNAQVMESIGASTFGVIAEYLYSPQKIAWPQILLMLPFLIWCVKYFRGGRTQTPAQGRGLYDGLVAAIAVGFIGALSMLVLLKSHAAIHGFDIVVWNLPMNFFLALFYWQCLKDRFSAKISL